MTIRAEDDPLLSAAVNAETNKEVDPAISTLLGDLYTRVIRLVKLGNHRTVISLPDFGTAEDPDDPMPDSDEQTSPSLVEMLEWTITKYPISEVITPDGSSWYLYPLMRSEVELTDDGVHEADGAVAVMLANAGTADKIDIDHAAEILQIYVYDENEDGTNVYWSTDFADYAFTDREVVARYTGLVEVIEHDIGSQD